MKDTFLKKNATKIYNSILGARLCCQLVLAATSYILYYEYVPPVFGFFILSLLQLFT